MAPRRLKNLVIEEVSSVDRGAGEGVKVLLMKRDDQEDDVIDLAAIRAALALAKKDPNIDAEVKKLRDTIAAIQSDAKITDKDAAAALAVKQFKDAVGIDPDKTEKTMTEAEIQKKIDEAVTAAVKKVTDDSSVKIAKLELDAAFAKMPAAHQEFAKAMSEDDKKKFVGKPDAEREKEVEEAKKRAAGDPVVKALQATNEELTKRLAVLEGDKTAADFAKRATDLGLPAAHGEVMRKAYGGDAEAQKKHDELLKGMAEQIRTGKVFVELGNNRSGNGAGTAYDALMAKAQELRKTETKLTIEQAFAKVYEDSANSDLVQKHKSEEAIRVAKGTAGIAA